MRMKPSAFVESTARRCCFRSEIIKLSQWFLWSDFRRRFWLGNGHSWWYVLPCLILQMRWLFPWFILERIIDVMKRCFLFVLVKVDILKVILLRIWLILWSRNENFKKSVLPHQPLHCLSLMKLFAEELQDYTVQLQLYYKKASSQNSSEYVP